jgi:hypothetical protein
MIRIKENILDKNTIAIEVDGVLDQVAIPVLETVCDRNLVAEKRVVLNLEGVLHITREGRGFLRGIQEKVQIANLPEFMKLEQEC